MPVSLGGSVRWCRLWLLRACGAAPAGSEPLGIIAVSSAACPEQVRVGEGQARASQSSGTPCLCPRAAACSGWGWARPCLVPASSPPIASVSVFPHPHPCRVSIPASSPSPPRPLPFPISIAALSSSLHHFPFSSSPSLPCHHPCLVPFPVSFPIFPHPYQGLCPCLSPFQLHFPFSLTPALPAPTPASHGSSRRTGRSPQPRAGYPGTCCGAEPPGPGAPGPLPLPGPLCRSHKALPSLCPRERGEKCPKPGS